MGRPKKQKEPSESQHQEQQQYDEEQYDEDEDELMSQFAGQAMAQDAHNKELLQMIKKKAEESQGGQVLTWNALYALKAQQIQLNEKMNQQIEALKDKYKLLKQPIFNRISDVALGVKVDKQLYNPEGLPKGGDPAKVTPRPIQDFWGQVLEKQGLLSEEVDVGVFNSLAEFVCELVDPQTNRIRIVFSFNGNDYFSNQRLEGEFYFDGEKQEPNRVIKQAIKYKSAKAQHSLFTILFDSQTEIGVAYNIASDVYESYCSSLLCFFREDDDEQGDGEQGEQGDQEQDSEVEAVQKPKKKAKTEPKNNEKPECKQQ